MPSRRLAAALLPVLATGVAACGSSGSAKTVRLVAYSTPQAAYKALIPAFQATSAGKGVRFTTSFGASGDQSRAVLAGLPADLVNLSLTPDVSKLVKAGLVSPTWNSGPTKGFVTNSLVVIVVRKGNPKKLHSWDDLVKPGVQVITPNPLSSGSARWNVVGAYGAQLREGKTPAQAQAYLNSLFHHLAAQPASARDALQTFLAGKGDALLDYESEAIPAVKKGEPLQYVVPTDTILIQNAVALVTRGSDNKAAQAFLSYLLSPAGQRIWASKGYRPAAPGDAAASPFPTPPGLFTISSLGGWSAVTSQFFATPTGIVTKIEQGLGVSSAK